jgi:hypothetical protein
MLPRTLIEPLRTHLSRVRLLHERDLAEGYGRVYLPFASIGSIRTRIAIGAGSTSSLRHADPSIRARMPSADTTQVPMYCNVQSRTLCVALAS